MGIFSPFISQIPAAEIVHFPEYHRPTFQMEATRAGVALWICETSVYFLAA